MIDKLNDDCWFCILQYLDLEDQLAVAQLSDRLQTNVRKNWRHMETVLLRSSLVERFEKQPEDMHEFLKLACTSLRKLELQKGTMQLLQQWQVYSFPKLRTLNCEMVFNEVNADQETLLLIQLFPHLHNLKLHSCTSGRHLWEWSQLQELHLIWCEYLNTMYFERIFGTLSLRKLTLLYYGYNVNLGEDILPASECNTLEELVIDDHHLLGEFLPNLLQLPNLRKLAFYTRDYYEYLLDTVANLLPDNVHSLLFNDVFWSSQHVTESILRMPNLRSLALQADDLETHLLYNICAKLPHLEQLHLMQMRSMPTATQLWHMVDSCKTLNVLNLSNTHLNAEFLDLSTCCLPRVLSKRPAPLVLHCHNNHLNARNIKAALKHPNLELSFEPAHLNIWSSRFIEIEFKPTYGRKKSKKLGLIK